MSNSGTGKEQTRSGFAWLRTTGILFRVWVVAILLIGLIAWRLHDSNERARFLRADADLIVNDPVLSAFALKKAKPAYAEHCAGCHGDDLRGNHGQGAPDFTKGVWLYGSGQVSELERTITYGIRSGRPKSWNLADMPAFAQAVPYKKYAIPPLAPGQIRDVIEYLISQAGKPADESAAKRGGQIFAGDGVCYDCHSNDARGDTAIGAPGLLGPAWLYGDGSREALFQSIAHGHQGICPGWVGDHDPVAVRALAFYVHDASRAGQANKTAEAAQPPVQKTADTRGSHE
jgi:cytochrome c oxidase cbb3-type subunit 3